MNNNKKIKSIPYSDTYAQPCLCLQQVLASIHTGISQNIGLKNMLSTMHVHKYIASIGIVTNLKKHKKYQNASKTQQNRNGS